MQTLAYANVHLMCADPVTGKFDKAGVAAAASAGAAAVATFLFLPLDVVRARLTVQGNGHTRIGPRPYSGIWNCISSIRQREGVRALYRGLTPAVLCKGFCWWCWCWCCCCWCRCCWCWVWLYDSVHCVHAVEGWQMWQRPGCRQRGSSGIVASVVCCLCVPSTAGRNRTQIHTWQTREAKTTTVNGREEGG